MSGAQGFPAKSDFRAAVGTQFSAEGTDGSAFTLTLRRLMNYPPGGGDTGLPPGSESYSLFFVGPPERVIPQATYCLRNDVIGVLDLFLVPVGRSASAVEYEAVVNRLPA